MAIERPTKPKFRAGSLIDTVFGDIVAPRSGKVAYDGLARILAPSAISDSQPRTPISLRGAVDNSLISAISRVFGLHSTTVPGGVFDSSSVHSSSVSWLDFVRSICPLAVQTGPPGAGAVLAN